MIKRLWLIFIPLLLFISLGVFFHKYNNTVYTSQTLIDHSYHGKLKVVSFNIRYGKGLDGRVNLQRTLATLKQLDADIISLQEVERYSFRSNFYDQVNAIAKKLNMHVVFYPSLAQPGFYYGNAILSKFPITETSVLPFNNSFENRAAVIAIVALPNLQEFYVINTHLGLNVDERQKAITSLHDYMAELNEPIILTGDLNTTPEMYEYEMWDDYLVRSNKGIPLQTFHIKNWQIDYIFHSSEFIVDEITVFENDASDHYPIVGFFRLSEQ